jgi:hypothetical protein
MTAGTNYLLNISPTTGTLTFGNARFEQIM